jgi:hypothetical protein
VGVAWARTGKTGTELGRTEGIDLDPEKKTAASSGTGDGDRGKVVAATRRGEELNL